MLLLFVPAFACDGDLYEPLVPLLRPEFECKTVVVGEPHLAAGSKVVLDAAEGRPFVVVGTSFGGHVAREVAMLAPGQVKGLVVMGAGAAGPADRAPFDGRRAAIEADGGAQMLEEMARTVVFDPQGRGEAAADTFRAMAARAPVDRLLAQNEALMTRPDRAADLVGINCPALLIWGDEDRFSRPEDGRAMAAAMPDATFVLLEECGHLPSLETPMRVASEIRARFAARPATI